jgi:Peptidase family M1 domain
VLIGLAVCVAGARAAVVGPTEKPAETLYLQLGQVGLDPARVYHVREASLDRSAVHITLEDGMIGFTQDVMGRITGAFFEGEGEVLLTPPDEVERRSMSLFTGMAILEEHFATAYFRFNDDAAEELRPDLRATEDAQEFIDRWGGTMRNLANSDAMRLLMTFSLMLPEKGSSSARADVSPNDGDQYLHARLQGTKLGVFDVFFDSRAAEQVQAGQARTTKDGSIYYDVWTSFTPVSGGGLAGKGNPSQTQENGNQREDWLAIRHYSITTEVEPPSRLHAKARMQTEVKESGRRALLFELSRYLQVESVKLDGEAVEFIHNPAMEGTQLERGGNDAVAVILPQPTKAGQKINLEFDYGGEVLAEAGGGLLYVGARGTWYPNRGMAMADYDLEFHYPPGWTLVATGKPAPPASPAEALAAKGEQASRWVSERAIPFAGFNLGKYRVATARAGNVAVETYATQGVERNFPNAGIQSVEPRASDETPQGPLLTTQHRPSPAQNQAAVAESAARAIEYFAQRFGPYPYSHLALTQMPGRDSQGWPGLIFLSSYAFLSEAEREQMHYDPAQILLQRMIPAHETAHQWWGDLITWDSYRDQWFSEGLANYTALMMLQEKDPMGFRLVMEKYRRDLVTENKDGMAPKDAGPVTLGGRLQSSRFPGGYDAISYGRATWLFHMLRTMLKDSAAQENGSASKDEPFVRALRNLRQRFEGRPMNTRDLLGAFAEELPPAARYEGKKSLDWFMDSWVNGTILPTLELKGVKFSSQGAGSFVSGTILQKDAPQDLVTSVPIYAVLSGRQSVLLGRVFADGEESTFRLPVPAGAHKILLDPEQTILTSPK